MSSLVLGIKNLVSLIHLKFILKSGIDKKTRIILVLDFIFLIFVIGIQFHIIPSFIDNSPLFITLIATATTLVYCLINSGLKTIKLEKVNKSLKDATLYNKNLQLLQDNLRCFKHDMANTMQCIGGYIANNNMEGLKKYYKNVQNECNNINNLTALNPSLINDSGLYSLLTSKYYLAEKNNIKFNVSICTTFDKLNIPSFVLTKILGILLDNAIDAAKDSKEKEIYFEVRSLTQNSSVHKSIILVENSYSNKDVDVDKIREKGYTSKTSDTGSHGLGLWEVNRILKKSNNLNLYTSKDEKYFKQQLEIYG